MIRNFKIFHGDEVVDEGKHDVTWTQVRKQRDAELRDTDWRAVKDRVLPTVWKDYREALRNLPQDHAEANDAADAWPVKPDD